MQTNDERVKTAAAEFPAEFGLRAWPGDVFSISLGASFVSGDEVMLYTQVKHPTRWLHFCKGTVAELRREIVPIPR